MSIAILLQQILIIFLEIGTGAAVTKLGIMDDRNSKFLSNLVMSVTLPCTLLASASIDGGREAVAGMLKGYVVLEIFYILTIGICLVLSRAMHLTRGQKAVLVGAAVMPNSAFIGIPLISALLGSEAGALYGAAGIMAYNILFFTYVQHLFDPEAKVSIKAFLTPTNITTAIMVVMLVTGLRLPAILDSFCKAVGNTTTPLQGVGRISEASESDDYEISNFSSTLDSSNGAYTSTATQDVSYRFWFATDTATNTRTFVFDGNCWKPTGDTAVSNMQTKTNFAGKKFEYTDTGSGIFKSGTTNSTIEFTSDGENGQVAATYSLDWKYSGDTSKNSSGQYYLPVNLSGNLTGAIEHEFGKDNFSIELNDAENQVTFTGGESYATISAGDGESNTMSLSAATNTKYFESPFQTSTYRMSMGTYVEKA